MSNKLENSRNPEIPEEASFKAASFKEVNTFKTDDSLRSTDTFEDKNTITKEELLTEVKERIADVIKESDEKIEGTLEKENLKDVLLKEGEVRQGGYIQTFTETYKGSEQFVGAPIVEVITDETIVIEHQDDSESKAIYEGKVIEKHDLGTEIQTHIAQPILKQIHQNVVHEHHKDVLVEHSKDVVHEHHQQVIHEHHQPVIIEKHIHEHIQPVIHEKHVTLVDEVHVPIVHEAQSYQTNQEEKEAIMHEHIEEAIVKEVFEKPTIVETIEKTVVINEGETDAQKILEKRFTTVTEKSADLETLPLELDSKKIDAQFNKLTDLDAKLTGLDSQPDLESKATCATEDDSKKSFGDLKDAGELQMADDLKKDDLAVLNV